jgi:N-acetyl-alpha-D-glucosaminyl L-malate synthase BshA
VNIGILCYPTSGGSGVLASELGAALASRGHDVHVLSYRRPFRMQPLPERFHYHEITVPQYPLFEYPSYGMAAACRVADVARDAELDVVHAHYAFPHGVSAHLAREIVAGDPRSFRIVTTLHGTDVLLVEQDAGLNCITKMGITTSDAVTAVSDALRRRTLAWFGLTSPIDVIPNFVDTGRFRPARREGAERVVVHVSNFRPVKRSADAVRAFYMVRQREHARLWMVGTGPEADGVREMAEKLGVADDVVWMGEDRAIHEILPHADVFLSTSEFEGFGLAALEAMACGVPVVATGAGGIAELVDADSGFLVPVGDVAAMADRMARVFDAPSMREAARQRTVDRFDTSKVVPQYEALYERAIEKRKAANA